MKSVPQLPNTARAPLPGRRGGKSSTRARSSDADNARVAPVSLITSNGAINASSSAQSNSQSDSQSSLSPFAEESPGAATSTLPVGGAAVVAAAAAAGAAAAVAVFLDAAADAAALMIKWSSIRSPLSLCALTFMTRGVPAETVASARASKRTGGSHAPKPRQRNRSSRGASCVGCRRNAALPSGATVPPS